jgi:hypothetical protein
MSHLHGGEAWMIAELSNPLILELCTSVRSAMTQLVEHRISIFCRCTDKKMIHAGLSSH